MRNIDIKQYRKIIPPLGGVLYALLRAFGVAMDFDQSELIDQAIILFDTIVPIVVAVGVFYLKNEAKEDTVE